MDWSNIAGAVLPHAPKIGTVLGTIVGGPIGATIGGLAGSALAAAFGVEETPEAVGKAIAEDPDAAEKLERLESERGQEIIAAAQVAIEEQKQLTARNRIAAQDTQDARAFALQLAQAGSPLSWGASILATVFTVAFFTLFAVILTTELKENQVIMAFVGTLTAGMIQILAYFFGSSAGSRDKDARFENLASQTISRPNPSIGTIEAIKAAAKGRK